MGKYVQLAEQVLQRESGVSVNEKSQRRGGRGSRPTTYGEKSELSELSPSVQSVDSLRGKFLRGGRVELRLAAGEDWDEFSVPAKILGFADNLAIEQIREINSIPNHYTLETECKRCGPVPIFEGCPPKINGCPWCLNRHRGLPIPTIGKNK